MKITFSIAGLLLAGAAVEGARAQSSPEVPDFTVAECAIHRAEFMNVYMEMTGNAADGSAPSGPAQGARALGTPVVAEHVARLRNFFSHLSEAQKSALEYEELMSREGVSAANRTAFVRQYGAALESAHVAIASFQSEFNATSQCKNRLLFHPAAVVEERARPESTRRLFPQEGPFGCRGVEYPPSRLSRARIFTDETSGEQWLTLCSLITEVELGFLDNGYEVGNSSRVCSALNLSSGEIRGSNYDAAINSPHALRQNQAPGNNNLVAAWATYSGADYVEARIRADATLNAMCSSPAAEEITPADEASSTAPAAPSEAAPAIEYSSPIAE